MLPMPSAELIERYGGPGPRYTSYPPATEWTDQVGTREAAEALARAEKRPAPLSIYVHLPFCVEMCRFCGCNVIATRDRSRADAYLDTLEREIQLWASRLPHRREVSQVHLGGGTPTFLSEAQLARLDSILRKWFRILPGAEMALEADPDVTTVGQIKLLGMLGFNRISFGIQDLEPRVQEAIARIQSAEKTEEVIRTARAYGFRGVNVDLMYGLPYQTPETMKRTLARVLAMNPDRTAIFGYAHVPWVKPQQRLLPQAALPSPVQRVELFVTAARAFEEAGYRQIGLDHFARGDDELVTAQQVGVLTRNFQGYSVRAAPDTLAFGVSSISDVDGTFLQNSHRLSEWTAEVDAGRLPVERGLRRTQEDELRGTAIRMLMCLLRLDIAPLVDEFGPDAERLFADAREPLKALEKDGLISLRANGLDVLPMGRIFLRSVAMVFDAYLERHANGQPAFSRAV
jgi:oxygen-independent coproporphyrinogen-3 oxidase